MGAELAAARLAAVRERAGEDSLMSALREVSGVWCGVCVCMTHARAQVRAFVGSHAASGGLEVAIVAEITAVGDSDASVAEGAASTAGSISALGLCSRLSSALAWIQQHRATIAAETSRARAAASLWREAAREDGGARSASGVITPTRCHAAARGAGSSAVLEALNSMEASREAAAAASRVLHELLTAFEAGA